MPTYKHTPRKFKISRKTWHRGGKGSSALLVAETGKKCCLGFFCLASGFAPNDIRGKGMPTDIANSAGVLKFPSVLQDSAKGGVFQALATANDDSSISEQTREERVKAHFERLGVIAEFED